MALKKRSEVSVSDTWNLESIYADDRLWEEDYNSILSDIAGLEALKGKIAENIMEIPGVLAAAYEMFRRVSRLSVYAHMRLDQDRADSRYLEMSSKADNVQVKVSSAFSFINPEILSYSQEEIKKAEEKNGAFEDFKIIIDNIMKEKAHTRSAEVENVLADSENISSAAENIFTALMNADMKFPSCTLSDGSTTEINNSNFVSLLESGVREDRKKVFELYYGQLKKFENTFSELYSANLKQFVFYAKERNYSSDRAMSLADADIPESVYDNLINAVHEALPDMYRYVNIRKKLLKTENIHMYDVYTPLFKSQDKVYDFDTAKEIVLKALKPLGEEYVSAVEKGIESRWIDRYPNEGKRSGAYSWGCYDSQPFVLLNYMNRLDDVFTLAHELGHSMHSYYSKTNQKFQYANYKLFVAEVASTCNECLLMNYLINNTEDREELKYLINHYLDSFKGTVFRQTMFAEFEKITHKMCEEGKPLTASELNRIYKELNEKYFGPDMTVDEGIGCEWMRIPHFYSPFYVYQYATGYSAAVALSANILNNGEKAVEDYLNFLKGGSSKTPIELLKAAGVDMASEKPVQDALRLFGDLVDKLEKLI